MEKSNVKDLYYFNPKELRDQKELIDGKVVVKKETSPEYQWILDKLDKILPAYEGLNNPTIKRLYVPTVLVINPTYHRTKNQASNYFTRGDKSA